MKLVSSSLFMTEADEKKIILDVAQSRYVSANVAGSILIARLESDVSFHDLVKLLESEFGLSPTEAERDCGAFVKALREREWLEMSPQDHVDVARRRQDI